jgi:two-component system nitrogen regulation response regulator GlnG
VTSASYPACRFDTPGSFNTPLVVIAEDNAELRTLLAGALERDGYRVAQAATGARLVALVEDLLGAGEPLQLVITDVRMPEVGGLDAARALLQAGHRVPLILMTAYSDGWTRSRAAELGAILLDKPLSLDTLRREVRRAVDGLAARP